MEAVYNDRTEVFKVRLQSGIISSHQVNIQAMLMASDKLRSGPLSCVESWLQQQFCKMQVA